MPNDIRTQAIVLRRTNYGETDRILNLLTPAGKLSVLAKGVRKEKSRLAGGIELFSVADVVVHQGRSNLGTLTSTKMLRFYGGILSDINRLELASNFLKSAERASEQTDNEEYFDLVDQALAGLDRAYYQDVVRTWFDLRLAQAMGEEINFISDTNGEDLNPKTSYFWDAVDRSLRPHPQGNISATEIKLGRLLLTSKLESIVRIANISELISSLDPIARTYK